MWVRGCCVSMPKKRENLVVQAVDSDILILDLESNQIHQLNSTAGFLWNVYNNVNTLDQLQGIYAAQYDVAPAVAEADVQNVIDQLLLSGLLIAD